MITNKIYGTFPIVEKLKVNVPESELREPDQDLPVRNLKKEFVLPMVLNAPDFRNEWPLVKGGYRFFVSK